MVCSAVRAVGKVLLSLFLVLPVAISFKHGLERYAPYFRECIGIKKKVLLPA